MAHTLVNGAPLSISTGDEAIWELADALESELMEIEEGAKRAMQLLRPLLKLAPKWQSGDVDLANGRFGAGNRTADG
jgi:hypothetical protein